MKVKDAIERIKELKSDLESNVFADDGNAIEVLAELADLYNRTMETEVIADDN